MSTTPDLGTIITNASARKGIYAAYGIVAFIVGGTAAYFLGVGEELPRVLIGAQAVVAYTGIAVGGLALANTTQVKATLSREELARLVALDHDGALRLRNLPSDIPGPDHRAE